ncbi:piggyBac transposable element-derived protein 3 [Trichonephila inaurata madagascariensis]|uniref:PiggyBac transposable element-derived protein 3 n=1 Tax=Trichonephila inaurata madagascariensis TaxID=2747483 RepID=A0A8X7CEU7_9ARAC|nr:piggyBac transposable element-derived protein 3 [Trichonephila inaurata madagascariensis]
MENVKFFGKNRVLLFLVNPSYSQDTIPYNDQYYNHLHHVSFSSTCANEIVSKTADEVNLHSTQKNSNRPRHFEKLRSRLHFNDNAKTTDNQSPDHDKLYKLRFMLDYPNKRCLLVPMSEGTQTNATKARHHMKSKSHK